MNSTDVKVLVYNLANTASDWQGDTVLGHILKAPAAGAGGAITILSAYAVNQAATDSGTSFALSLLNYGTAGTAVEGTVASGIGGTADAWEAGVPKEFTISDGKLEAGEWLVLYKDEENSSDPTRCSVIIEYVMGG
ncbi:MAG: hypothetical protein JW910_22950 [Anaerolineae bacterium]|nr:hypothetical protein [Anaerolineae bacterium]